MIRTNIDTHTGPVNRYVYLESSIQQLNIDVQRVSGIIDRRPDGDEEEDKEIEGRKSFS